MYFISHKAGFIQMEKACDAGVSTGIILYTEGIEGHKKPRVPQALIFTAWVEPGKYWMGSQRRVLLF